MCLQMSMYLVVVVMFEELIVVVAKVVRYLAAVLFKICDRGSRHINNVIKRKGIRNQEPI